MNKRSLTYSLLCLVLSVCAIFLLFCLALFLILPSAEKEYRLLLTEAQTTTGQCAIPWEKRDVQKVIISRSPNRKVEISIEAKESYFLLENNPEGNFYFETFLDLEGRVRETGRRTFIRSFSAEKATYDYTQHLLQAFQAQLKQGSREEEPLGSGSLQSSFVEGFSDEMECSFHKHGEMDCCLKNFRGTLIMPGHTPIEASVPFLQTEEEGLSALEDPDQKKRILISVGEEDQFFCGKGAWSWLQRRGSFFASEDGSPVQFFHTPVNRSEQAVSFSLSSKELEVTLAEKRAEQAPLDLLEGIETIRTFGQVHIEYDENICLDAEEGVYRNGILTLWADPKRGTCYGYDNYGNILETNQLEINFISSLLTFSKPKGTLFGEEEEAVHIRADHLVWDPHNHRFTLMGHIFLDHPSWGHEETVGELVVYTDAEERSPRIQALEAKGKNTLTFMDSSPNYPKRLTCTGTLLVDEAAGKISLTSSPAYSQQIGEAQRGVIFEDRWGTMFADHLEVVYQSEEGVRHLETVILRGNVAIMNRFLKTADAESDLLQYALADEITFYPDSKELFLKADDPRRVLFFDQGNHLQVSASALKIHRDPLTKQDSFQGIGNVRFSLQESEIKQIREQFQFFSNG